jgi:hypothetical protein
MRRPTDLTEQTPDGLGIDEPAHRAQQPVDPIDRRQNQLLNPFAMVSGKSIRP